MEKTKIINKRKSSYIASLTFLVFVLALTFGLYIYNGSLEKSNLKIENNISDYNNSIEEYEYNEKLKIYSLVQLNKKYLEQLESNSKIINFLDHMDYIQKLYDLKFRGFVLNGDIISTSVIIVSDEYSDTDYKLAYQKLVNFISKYRKDEKALFDMEFINRIVGYDEMKFDVNFKINKTDNINN